MINSIINHVPGYSTALSRLQAVWNRNGKNITYKGEPVQWKKFLMPVVLLLMSCATRPLPLVMENFFLIESYPRVDNAGEKHLYQTILIARPARRDKWKLAELIEEYNRKTISRAEALEYNRLVREPGWFPHKSCIFSGLAFSKPALQKCDFLRKLFRNWSFRTTLISTASFTEKQSI